MRIREYNFVDPGASGSGREIVAGDADEGLEEEVGISPNSNFVSARMTPFESAYSDANLKQRIAAFSTSE